MKLAIMQPYFMPYLGYFQAIHAVDKYILYSNLSFIKDGWMNRNRILIKDGKVAIINVPLIHKSSNTFIFDIRIDNTRNWNKKLIKSILLNYKGSQYFEDIYPFFEKLLSKSYNFLYQLNADTIIEISRFMGITTPIEFENRNKYRELEIQLSNVEKGDYTDFEFMQKTKPIKKVARVLAISAIEKADVFINAIGGQELYDKNEFASYGIDLKFIKTGDINYPQFSKEFVPNLSIIDVLMHNGKEATRQLLNEFTLI